MINQKPRIIAYYLPQFYPIPENDAWWGDGFTEWTNVKNARPLFKGHDQPHAPGQDLGYYDLRDTSIRQYQADLAREHGIEAFCYWHYWFGNGKRLLDRVFNEVLESGKPDFPFCLAWANHSWLHNKFSKNGTKKILMKQEYPGPQDHQLHFETLLPAFLDLRYVKVDGKPLFVIYRPNEMPDLKEFINRWQNLAIQHGLPGIHFVAITYKISEIPALLEMGFQGINIIRLFHYINSFNLLKREFILLRKQYFNRGSILEYKKCALYFQGKEDSMTPVYPCIFPNWDHSPRSGRKEHILINSTPFYFQKHVEAVMDLINKKPPQHQLVFLKSWNEWAEGNYIEPDMKFGNAYLQTLKSVVLV